MQITILNIGVAVYFILYCSCGYLKFGFIIRCYFFWTFFFGQLQIFAELDRIFCGICFDCPANEL